MDNSKIIGGVDMYGVGARPPGAGKAWPAPVAVVKERSSPSPPNQCNNPSKARKMDIFCGKTVRLRCEGGCLQ